MKKAIFFLIIPFLLLCSKPSETKRSCDCEPVSGRYYYEDGVTEVLTNSNSSGAITYSLDQPDAPLAIIQATSELITFQSDRKLSPNFLLHSTCSQFPRCTHQGQGELMEIDGAYFLTIKAEDFFNCIWPQQEEFNFRFSLCRKSE